MRAVYLDCRAILSREALHGALARTLDLPEWYGRNLDALADCLGDIAAETELHMVAFAALEQQLGEYAARLHRVLTGAQAENPSFRVVF